MPVAAPMPVPMVPDPVAGPSNVVDREPLSNPNVNADLFASLPDFDRTSAAV